MKNASAQLIALLNSGAPFFMADLVTITLADASVLRWTGADTDLTEGGRTFSAQGPLIKRTGTRVARGLEVDTMTLTLMAGETTQILGIPLPLAAHNGAFDGATVMLERAFMPTWGDTSPGTLVMFEGSVAGVDPTPTDVKLVAKSELEKLNIPLPRNLFMPKCNHALFSAGCGVVKGTYLVTGTATGTPTTTSIPSARGEAASYFQLGVLVMTSGPAAGSRRAVKAFSGGTFTLDIPLPVAPVAGNTFTVVPGCDHSTGANGCTKFANLNRFRGFPFVPRPETAR